MVIYGMILFCRLFPLQCNHVFRFLCVRCHYESTDLRGSKWSREEPREADELIFCGAENVFFGFLCGIFTTCELCLVSGNNEVIRLQLSALVSFNIKHWYCLTRAIFQIVNVNATGCLSIQQSRKFCNGRTCISQPLIINASGRQIVCTALAAAITD